MLNVEEESKGHSNGKHKPSKRHQNSHPSQNKDALVEIWRRTLNKWNPFDDKVVKPGIYPFHYIINLQITKKNKKNKQKTSINRGIFMANTN